MTNKDGFFSMEPGSNLEKLRDFSEQLVQITKAVHETYPKTNAVEFDLTAMHVMTTGTLRPHWCKIEVIGKDSDGLYPLPPGMGKHAAIQEMVWVSMLASGLLVKTKTDDGVSYGFVSHDVEELLTRDKIKLAADDMGLQVDLLTRKFSAGLDAITSRNDNSGGTGPVVTKNAEISINTERLRMREVLADRIGQFKHS